MKNYISDILMGLGLSMMGAGLFLTFNSGVSLSVVGTLILLAGFFRKSE